MAAFKDKRGTNARDPAERDMLNADTLAPELRGMLDQLGTATGNTRASGNEIVYRAIELRENMILAASRLRRQLDKMAEDDPDRPEIESEYVRACQYRAVADSALGSAFALDKSLGGQTPPVQQEEESGSAAGSAKFRNRRAGGASRFSLAG